MEIAGVYACMCVISREDQGITEILSIEAVCFKQVALLLTDQLNAFSGW